MMGRAGPSIMMPVGAAGRPRRRALMGPKGPYYRLGESPQVQVGFKLGGRWFL
jgi:hypothetical protein